MVVRIVAQAPDDANGVVRCNVPCYALRMFTPIRHRGRPTLISCARARTARRVAGAPFMLLAVAASLAALLVGCSSSNTGTQEVAIWVTEDGFTPDKQTVPRGVPVTLIVTRTTDQTCATSFKIPSLDQTVELPLGQHVRIELPGGIQDTLQYSCGMDMLHGMVIGK